MLLDKTTTIFPAVTLPSSHIRHRTQCYFIPIPQDIQGYKDFHIRICEVQQVHPEEQQVTTSIGSLSYDYLIISTGCYTNYFGNNEIAKRTMSLKTTAEALHNRNQVLESFEKH